MSAKKKTPRYHVGDKLIVLYQVTKVKGGDTTVKNLKEIWYGKDWDTKTLEDALDHLEDMIWRDEWPDLAMLRDYLNFTYPEGTRMPQSIRVPKELTEIILSEREQHREGIRKEHEEMMKGMTKKQRDAFVKEIEPKSQRK
jgi:hypothetical protein